MPRTKKSSKSKRSSGASNNASSIRYTGSLRAGSDTRPITVTLSYPTQAAVTAASNVALTNNVFDTSSVNSSSRWSSLKVIYQEWRPVALKLTWVPQAEKAFVASHAPATFGYDQTDTIGPMVLCPYKGSASAITSYLNAFEHQVRVFGPLNRMMTASVRMDEADEASWVSTSGTTPGAVMGVKVFNQVTTAGASDILSLGFFITDIVVQFRFPVATSLQQPREEKQPIVDRSSPMSGGGGGGEFMMVVTEKENSERAEYFAWQAARRAAGSGRTDAAAPLARADSNRSSSKPP